MQSVRVIREMIDASAGRPFVPMFVAIAVTASILLGAVGAQAGSSISTGLVFVGDGEVRSCRVPNIRDQQTLHDVTSRGLLICAPF